MISNNYYKLRSHNSPRTTLPFSPLINAGKILIYANCDYHKLHFFAFDPFFFALYVLASNVCKLMAPSFSLSLNSRDYYYYTSEQQQQK